MCYTGTTRVSVQNFAAERRAISQTDTKAALKYLVMYQKMLYSNCVHDKGQVQVHIRLGCHILRIINPEINQQLF